MQIKAFICNIQLVKRATDVHKAHKKLKKSCILSLYSKVTSEKCFPLIQLTCCFSPKKEQDFSLPWADYVRLSISVLLGDLDGLSFFSLNAFFDK